MSSWMTIKELMEELHVSRATAYRIAHHLPTLRIGSSLRVSREAIERYARCHESFIPTKGGDELWPR